MPAFDQGSGSWIPLPEAAILTGVEREPRTFHSGAPRTGANFLSVTTDAYYLYVGRTARAIIARNVEAYLNVLAAAGLTAFQFGVFSSPNAPSKAGQNLTCLAAGNTEDLTVGLGRKRLAAAIALTIPQNTHVWIGFRMVSAGACATLAGVLYDLQEGTILTTVGGAQFVVGNVQAGALIAAQTGALQVTCAPDLSLTLD